MPRVNAQSLSCKEHVQLCQIVDTDIHGDTRQSLDGDEDTQRGGRHVVGRVINLEPVETDKETEEDENGKLSGPERAIYGRNG